MGKNPYIVKFGGLPVGIHEYEFVLNDTFFSEYELNEVGRADVHVKGTLTKHNNLLQMHFSLDGTVGLACDRCLRDFDYPVEGEENLVIKHGNPDETTDEILVIPDGQEEFDVGHFLYEYVMTAIPPRRVPCEVDMERFQCDQATLEKLDQLSTDSEPRQDDDVWKELNKIKFNQN